ncbi:RHS repeat-associated core domain-containing protein [Tahibacter soli]|uniref:SpvB/TcaC N-terminal domain-containing protein n=1 Tax=Tahibacter soli TaxID=2983605 RepID=A0A9X3YPZ3_9GAMM|nr:RHS repeat-associated core domain-containing protein [Tahibacter soli]MDC8016254.1 SpvB/TcaC N-terminal domain-containing protein [Tahibacter soli]
METRSTPAAQRDTAAGIDVLQPAGSRRARILGHAATGRILLTLAMAATTFMSGMPSSAQAQAAAATASARDRGEAVTFERRKLPYKRPVKRKFPDFPGGDLLPAEEVGYLAGAGGVGSTGQATYSIPIAVPAGVRGMQPALSLNYDSDAGDGVLGIGWGLSGSSIIRRCHKSLRTDGVVDGISYADDDAICMDGKRLVRIGASPEGWGEYRSEASPFDRILRVGDSWKVFGKDGRISWYKAQALPRMRIADPNLDQDPGNDSPKMVPWRVGEVADGTAVLMWTLEKVEDRFGNWISYVYDGIVLKEIRYGFNADNTTYSRKIVFDYTGRPDVGPVSYVNGVRIAQPQLLRAIKIYAPAVPGGTSLQLTSQYLMLHDTSAKSGRSQLVMVKQCDGSSEIVPRCGWERTFVWKQAAAPVVTGGPMSDVQTYADSSDYGHGPVILDANGDGRQDVLYQETALADGWKLLLAGEPAGIPVGGDTFDIDGQTLRANASRFRIADINNDGRDDLIVGGLANENTDPKFKYFCLTWVSGPGQDHFEKCLAPETKLEYSNLGAEEAFSAPLWNFGDFNGDGRVDLIENDRVRLNLGAVGAQAQLQPSDEPADIAGPPFPFPWKVYNRGAGVSDLDGDGRAELMLASPVGVTPGTPGDDQYLWDQGEFTMRSRGLDATGAVEEALVPGLGNDSLMWAKKGLHNFPTWADSWVWEAERDPYQAWMLDINGDGLKDRLLIRQVLNENWHPSADAPGVYANNAFYEIAYKGEDEKGGFGSFVQFNTGRGFTPARRTKTQFRPLEMFAKWSLDQAYLDWRSELFGSAVDVVDLNGDGRDDVVVKSMHTLDFGTAPQVLANHPGGSQNPDNCVPADLHSNQCSFRPMVRAYLSTGDDFKLIEDLFDPGSPGIDPTMDTPYGFGHTRPVEIDGDGAPEYLRSVNKRISRVDLDLGPPEVIAEVRDEGSDVPREVFTYHDVSFPRTGDGCAYPIECPGRLLSRVDEHHVDVGRDRNGKPMYRRNKYSYWRPRSDLRGRGMLGFDSTETIDLDTGVRTTSTYELNTVQVAEFFPYAGTATNVTTDVPIVQAPDDGKPNLSAGVVKVWRTTVDNLPGIKLLNPDANNNPRSYFGYVSLSAGETREKPMQLNLVNGVPKLVEIGNLPGDILNYTTTTTAYDDWGNATSSEVDVLNGEKRVTTTTYLNDTATWLLGLPDVVTTTSLGQQRVVDHGYTDQGHLQTIQVQPNDPDPSVRSTTTRIADTRGLLIQLAEEAPGVPVRVDNLYYDADDVFPAQRMNALEHTNTVLRHPGLGVTVLTEDLLGNVATAKYDTFGRLRSTDGPTAMDVQNVSYAEWLSADGQIRGLKVRTQMTDGADRTIHSDELGRDVLAVHQGFDGSALHADRHYNLLGQLVDVSRPGKGAPSGFRTRMSYDTVGRPLKTVDPNEADVHYEYEPFLTHVYSPREPGDDPGMLGTLPYHHKRTMHADWMGRIDWTEEQGVVDQQPVTLHSRFAYGPFDLLTSAVDPQSNAISIRYDVLGRKIRITDPDAGVREFGYNGLHETISETTPLGVTIARNYDAIGRPTARTDSQGTTVYAWDLTPTGLGRLGATASPFVDQGPNGVPNGVADVPRITTEHTYNALGQPELSVLKFSAADNGATEEIYTTTKGYDSFGRPESIGYPSNAAPLALTLTYNAHGYPQSVARSKPGGGSQLVWETLARNADLALVDAKFGNDVLAHWSRDPVTGLVEKISARPVLSVDPAPSFEVGYGYDSAYNVKSRRWSGTAFGNRSIVEEFTYDILDRLSTWKLDGADAVRNGEYVYDYDMLGNMTGIARNGAAIYAASYGVNGKPNALRSYADLPGNGQPGLPVFPIYDAAGRQSIPLRRTVTYTDQDLPRQVIKDGATHDFRYVPAGPRVEKKSSDGRRTVYMGGLYEKRVAGNTVEHVYLLPGADGIAAQVTRTCTGSNCTEDIRYVVRDQLGSSSAAFDENGLVEAQVFDPWGERVVHTGGGALLDEVAHGFTDQRHETELGWIDMNARMYDPAQRRFLSADPIVSDSLFGAGRSRFSYVRNNPMRFTDPTGLAPTPGSAIYQNFNNGTDPSGGVTVEKRTFAGDSYTHSGGTRPEQRPSWSSNQGALWWATDGPPAAADEGSTESDPGMPSPSTHPSFDPAGEDPAHPFGGWEGLGAVPGLAFYSPMLGDAMHAQSLIGKAGGIWDLYDVPQTLYDSMPAPLINNIHRPNQHVRAQMTVLRIEQEVQALSDAMQLLTENGADTPAVREAALSYRAQLEADYVNLKAIMNGESDLQFAGPFKAGWPAIDFIPGGSFFPQLEPGTPAFEQAEQYIWYKDIGDCPRCVSPFEGTVVDPNIFTRPK